MPSNMWKPILWATLWSILAAKLMTWGMDTIVNNPHHPVWLKIGAGIGLFGLWAGSLYVVNYRFTRYYYKKQAAKDKMERFLLDKHNNDR